LRRSRTYETDPVGMTGARRFLNLVVSADTAQKPTACLQHLLEIERTLGRPCHTRNTPRTLDLDLLCFGRQVIDRPGLRIPHPRLHERAFVLVPFCDLAPGFVHPVLHRRMASLLAGTPIKGIRRWERN
jgi:2-amino-4-hydroxy-6-hydroxymethyldihydropteridine diphosphokinase